MFVSSVIVKNVSVQADSPPGNIAQAVIQSYKYHTKILYSYGMNSVMTHFERGDGETFYFHSFRHYVPHMMRKTLLASMLFVIGRMEKVM